MFAVNVVGMFSPCVRRRIVMTCCIGMILTDGVLMIYSSLAASEDNNTSAQNETAKKVDTVYCISTLMFEWILFVPWTALMLNYSFDAKGLLKSLAEL